jgi:hypothetical protein
VRKDDGYLVDNSLLKADANFIGFRLSKKIADKDEKSAGVPWGTIVSGIEEYSDDGEKWIKVEIQAELPAIGDQIKVPPGQSFQPSARSLQDHYFHRSDRDVYKEGDLGTIISMTEHNNTAELMATVRWERTGHKSRYAAKTIFKKFARSKEHDCGDGEGTANSAPMTRKLSLMVRPQRTASALSQGSRRESRVVAARVSVHSILSWSEPSLLEQEATESLEVLTTPRSRWKDSLLWLEDAAMPNNRSKRNNRCIEDINRKPKLSASPYTFPMSGDDPAIQDCPLNTIILDQAVLAYQNKENGELNESDLKLVSKAKFDMKKLDAALKQVFRDR